MGTAHFKNARRLTIGEGGVALPRRAPLADEATLVRILTLAVIAAGLSVALVTGGILDYSGPAPVTDALVAADDKDENRLAPTRERLASAAIDALASNDGNATGTRDDMGAAPLLQTAITAPKQKQGDWRGEEFPLVTVIDGRTLRTGAIAIRLDGLELPQPGQVCRTLDGRLEPCVARAATQLELLTRSRTVACRYRMTTSSEAIGSCRIGSQDLAERMIRTGYARAADGGNGPLARTGREEAPMVHLAQ